MFDTLLYIFRVVNYDDPATFFMYMYIITWMRFAHQLKATSDVQSED